MKKIGKNNSINKKHTDNLANDIVIHCRQKIQSRFPFLSVAIYYLEPELDEDIKTIGTDGYCLYYNPEYIIREYKKSKNNIYLPIVHILLHCLLRHFSKKQNTYYELYDVSMDLTVYLMLCELEFITIKGRQSVLQGIPELKDIFLENKKNNSGSIYNKAMRDESLGKIILDNAHIFKLDDHFYWTRPKKHKHYAGDLGRNQSQIWNNLFFQVAQALEKGPMQGHSTGIFAQLFLAENLEESQVSYEEYLKKFSSFEEVLKIDPEGFDLMWYTLGLDMYEDMPIIEYNEIKEDYIINEFVLAIDTSGSCSGKIMEDFLRQTIKVFKDMEIGNRRIKAKIIECDWEIVHEEDINFSEDIENYTNNFQAHGFSGTNFNPVFERIQELQDNGELKKLKGLIYLSDGDGGFPASKPPYDTVFVIPKSDWSQPDIPDWVDIIQL